MTRGFPRMMAFAAIALATLSTPARAQVTASAQCVGGAIGCTQVDFFFNSTVGSLTIDFFTLTLNTAGWQFVDPLLYVETEDAFGFNLFVPTSTSPTQVAGEFPFQAFLDPQLRFRTEMQVFGSDASTIGFSFAGSAGGSPVFSGTVVPSTNVAPEPMSMALLGTGLAGVGMAARRRRKREAEAE